MIIRFKTNNLELLFKYVINVNSARSTHITNEQIDFEPKSEITVHMLEQALVRAQIVSIPFEVIIKGTSYDNVK